MTDKYIGLMGSTFWKDRIENAGMNVPFALCNGDTNVLKSCDSGRRAISAQESGQGSSHCSHDLLEYWTEQLLLNFDYPNFNLNTRERERVNAVFLRLNG